MPAILEYIPYRKGDGTAPRDWPRHVYFAGHGYAALRVDLRGSGESDGLLHDEYLPLEQEDALEVLRWIAAQPWSTGAVGMFGISWGGFNGLQVAAHAPPELKAVITLCSTDDRYADDVHYKGGAVLALEMLSWGASMLSYNAIAPDPEVAGPGWRDAWLERIDSVEPYEYEWLRHQRRDEYWKQGSVCEDFAAIKCPVYAIGGWADGYSEAVLRLVAGLGAPSKGLLGPWSHAFPDEVEPGPAIGFLQECLRWWDQWLKGEDTGIADEPALRVWMQDPVAPAARHVERPGRWVAERAWPSPEIEERTVWLGEGVLLDEPDAREHRLEISTDLLCGLDSGVWCADGNEADAAVDQRADDGRSLSFTSAPLPERIELLGNARVELELESDRPVAQLTARLCDVAPDGASLLVTRGVLNLTHRDSHEHPAPLEPGERTRVVVELDGIAQAIPAGHRLRLALSPAYWPWLWPAPEPVTLAVHTAAERAGAAGARAARRGRGAAAVRGARGGAAAGDRDARARRRAAHAAARLRQRAHRADLRLGHRRALPDHGLRADRRLLGLHHLLDRSRRPALRRGPLPRRHGARPRRLGHARGDQRGDGLRRASTSACAPSWRRSRTASWCGARSGASRARD